MGREVRRVPADWQHPKNDAGRFIPLFPGEDYECRMTEFQADAAAYGLAYAMEVHGAISKADYMPNWTEEERTHLMMYENTSEGTPISPAFKTPEELALWLVDNKASAFGYDIASYEAWLKVARGGWATSMVVVDGVSQNGVEAMK